MRAGSSFGPTSAGADVTTHPGVNRPPQDTATLLDGGFRLVLVLAVVCAVLLGATCLLGASQGSGGGHGAGSQPAGAAPTATSGNVDLGTFLEPEVAVAPPLDLVDPDDQPLALGSMRGDLVLVFFGYTHCPDVCPATMGVLGQALAAYGTGARALFVTIDPARDTTAWLKQYVQYIPAGITPLTGTDDQIRSTAAAWGVKYARVDTGVPGQYSMSHTADVFVVDAEGRLRARLPFGTDSDVVTAVLRLVAATTPAATVGVSPTPTSPPSPASALALQAEVLSTSVWSGRDSPVILALYGPGGRLDDPSVTPSVQLMTIAGAAVGAPVVAVPVRPPGVADVSYVATLNIPSPGDWRLRVSAAPAGTTLAGSTDLAVLDPGTTPALGAPAPTTPTPTLDPSGDNLMAVTTDPIADLQLYQAATADLLAAHTPFVLVLDSYRFRVTAACGRALQLVKYLLYRWPSVGFVHDEPFAYSIVTNTPVLVGTLDDPTLTPAAAAWGIGGAPWGARSMPWIFIVDAHGIVRAKYQGVIGSDEVDVIVAMLAAGS